MQISVASGAAIERAFDLLAVPLTSVDPSHWRLPPRIAALDRALNGRLGQVLATGDFRGGRGESLLVYGDDGDGARRILLIGLGDESNVGPDVLRETAAVAVSASSERRGRKLAIVVPQGRRVRPPVAAQALAEGAVLAGYRFDRYRAPMEDGPIDVDSVTILLDKPAGVRAARTAVAVGMNLAESQNLARDLSNMPPADLPPAALARAAEKMAKEVGLRCRVLDVADLRKQKMGAILAVGGGSANPPRLIVLEHNAPEARKKKGGKRAPRRRPTICLIGKGVTFDSGGLSLKPSTSMVTMKHDMSGGAAVIGAMRAAALLRVPIHVVGVIGAAENMPSGTAYRPDDIVRTMSGKTVEIANTDAEGRLVLADALHYARSQFEPDAMIDVATLTGACAVALGKWSAAVLSNEERLSDAIRKAGDQTGERFWPLPLWDVHKEHMCGQIADLKQTGGRDGGTITAAAFLWHFVGDTPWAHLDIASMADTEQTGPLQPKGATGFAVRTLAEFLRGWTRTRAD